MQITKEKILQDVEGLLSQKKEALAKANACEGALQFCQMLLNYLEQETPTAPPVVEFPPGVEILNDG